MSIPNGRLREHLTITEQKTQKEARIVLNTPLQRAIIDYIREEGLKYDDYMFKSRKGKNRPLSTTQVHRIFQDAGQALGLEHFGSHSLRKNLGVMCVTSAQRTSRLLCKSIITPPRKSPCAISASPRKIWMSCIWTLDSKKRVWISPDSHQKLSLKFYSKMRSKSLTIVSLKYIVNSGIEVT